MSVRNFEEECRISDCRSFIGREHFFCDKHAGLRPLSSVLFDGSGTRSISAKSEPLTAVYVIGCRRTNAVKIGIAQDVIARIGQLQTGYPFPLKLYGAFYTKRLWAERLERICHDKMKEFDLHLKGEWFEAEPDDVIRLVVKLAEVSGNPVLTAGEYGAMLAAWDDLDHDVPDCLRTVRSKIKRDWLSDMLDKSEIRDKTRL